MDQYTLNEMPFDSYDHHDGSFFSWEDNMPINKPYVMSCDYCGMSNEINVFGPRCSDNKCTNCGYKVKENGFPKIKYEDVYYTGHTDGRKGKHIDYQVKSTLNKNKCSKMNKDDKKQDIEKFSTGSQIGLNFSVASSQLVFIFIAFLLFVARKDHEKFGAVGTMLLVLLILCFPYFYIIYAIIATIIEKS